MKFSIIAWLFITAVQVATVLTEHHRNPCQVGHLVRHQLILSYSNKQKLLSIHKTTQFISDVFLQFIPAALLQTGCAVYSLHYRSFLVRGSCRLLLEAFLLKLPYLSDMCLLGSVLTPKGLDCAPRWIISELLEFIQGTPQRAEPVPPNITA